MAAVGGPMTRSRIEAFDQTAQVLADLAERLRDGTQALQQASEAYVEQMRAPGGTEWRGQTATAYLAAATQRSPRVGVAVDRSRYRGRTMC
ncbi:hypothetical protein MHEC_01820 [Mycobacterium heckeshornense]|uniref:Uncharacterized protein n=1 Tax=Mycobacterium heckeshornense TaxID=110505 RepID=A0A7R7GQR2_9MYCO|nr:hypothetical protein MHEC_01820 [Mycobacterium heckeshornense]